MCAWEPIIRITIREPVNVLAIWHKKNCMRRMNWSGLISKIINLLPSLDQIFGEFVAFPLANLKPIILLQSLDSFSFSVELVPGLF